jgi:transcriptional regulator with XRE-family HTH domain
MSIGSTIKRLRREKNITQEQLAEYLGITSRAISQWECDRTAPDISQIPALCHIFDISSDVLLGIDIEKNNEKIKKYLTEAVELGNQGKLSERTEILREANKKFPRDYRIMKSLAYSLVCEYSRKGIKEYDEVFGFCNRIIAECTDSIIRYEAIDILGHAYAYAGKKEEMLKLSKEMPRANFSYESFMMYRWKGDADFKEFQEYLSLLISRTAEMIGLAATQRHDNGEFIYTLEEIIHLWETEVRFLDLVFPNGDYQSYAQLGESACNCLCVAFLRKQNFEEAWKWLEKGADFAIYMDTYDFDFAHTSTILRGYSSGGWIMEADGNRSQSLLEWLEINNEVAVLRSDSRYGEIVERLKKVAKKP